MLPNVSSSVANLYRVEVSGWDSTHAFFVEKADLEWSEESGKHLIMGRPLRESAIIFVRLLQPTASERSYPVPYEAELIATSTEGCHQYRLNAVRLRPRLAATLSV